MKRYLITLASSGLLLAVGMNASLADSHKGEDASDSATPIELFACTYNDGKGRADFDAVTDNWNDWADDQGFDDYSAWLLVPYYSGPEQDFDVLWLGASSSAQSLGAAQDKWLATGGEIAAQFAEVSTCNIHANFATLQFKKPPERENPSSIVVSFSDCKMSDGVSFDDLAPSLTAWAEFRSEQGSTAGHWVLFPAYGGGGEEFDFKFVAAWQNLEEQGVDYDNWDGDKSNELFADKVDCDSSRVYIATNVRMAESDDE